MIGCSLNVQLKEENVLCTSCTQKMIISKNETYPLSAKSSQSLN